MKRHCVLMALVVAGLAPGPPSWGRDAQDLRSALDLDSGPRPQRGWDIAMVRRHFGEPVRRLGPIGRPPITQWVYPDFIVYFEHQHAIHAVWTAPSSALSLQRDAHDSTRQAP